MVPTVTVGMKMTIVILVFGPVITVAVTVVTAAKLLAPEYTSRPMVRR